LGGNFLHKAEDPDEGKKEKETFKFLWKNMGKNSEQKERFMEDGCPPNMT